MELASLFLFGFLVLIVWACVAPRSRGRGYRGGQRVQRNVPPPRITNPNAPADQGETDA